MQPQLNNARLVPRYQAGDGSKSRAALLHIGQRKVRMVNEIQRLRPELHIVPLLNMEVFQNRKIQPDGPRAVASSPAGIPERISWRGREGAGIKPFVDLLGGRSAAAESRIADHVRPVAVRKRI